jgi:hypothetical protein
VTGFPFTVGAPIRKPSLGDSGVLNVVMPNVNTKTRLL